MKTPDRQPICHLELDIEPSKLADVRRTVRDLATRFGALDDQSDALVLAVDEAFQNIIRHAYRDSVPGRVDFSAWIDDHDLWIRLRDYAELVDLTKIRPRALDDVKPGGLGTHLIRSVMDEVSYRHADDGLGNVLTMRKRLG